MPDKGSVTGQQLGVRQTGRRRPGRRRRLRTSPGARRHAGDPPARMFANGVLPGDMLSDKHGMSNALRRVRRADRQRAPGRRLRPADRLLRPAAADAAGTPGPGHQRPRRVVRRGEHVRAARPRPGLLVERDDAGQDIIDTYALELCDPSGAPATKESNYYLYQGQCCRWRPSSARTPGARRWPTAPRPVRTPCGLPHQVRAGDAPRDRRRQAGRLRAAAVLATSTRSTR